MSPFNAAVGRGIELLLRPLAGLPAEVAVTGWSLLLAVVMLLAVKRFSNQVALDAVKRRIHACLFEIRLYNDDLRAIFRAQLELLRHNGRYLLLSLPPLIVMIVPVALLLVHLQPFYGYRPFRPGEGVLLEAQLNAAGPARPSLELEAPPGLTVETPAVWSPALAEVAWRLRATAAGDYLVTVRAGGEAWTKTVTVGGGVRRLSPRRPSASLADQLAWVAEPPVPAGGAVRAISVAYPPRRLALAGESDYAWMVALLVLSTALALALKKPLGVTL